MSNVTRNFEFWPSLEQIVFGLGGSVSILTDVMPHKLNALRTKQTFLEGQGKILRQADIKLAL